VTERAVVDLQRGRRKQGGRERVMTDYYTCIRKLAACTMESIVFWLRKTGLQK